MKGIIYKATNKINGKSYIGQAFNFIQRRVLHKHLSLKKNSSFYFHRAIRKYGWDNFEWKILERCDRDDLNLSEQWYIRKFDTFNNNFGYNMTTGGEGQKDFKHSEKIKREYSRTRKGKNNPMFDVHRFGKENPMYGKKHSAKTKEKIGQKAKNRKNPSLSERNKNNTGKTYEQIYGKERAIEIKKKRSRKLFEFYAKKRNHEKC